MSIASKEVRLCLINAYERGAGSCSELARVFDVHRNTASRWLREARQGKLAPAARGHNPRKIQGADEERLVRLIAENPAISVRELQAGHFPHVSQTTLRKTLHLLGLAPKQRQQQ